MHQIPLHLFPYVWQGPWFPLTDLKQGWKEYKKYTVELSSILTGKGMVIKVWTNLIQRRRQEKRERKYVRDLEIFTYEVPIRV